MSDGNLVSIKTRVNGYLLSKTAKFWRKWLSPASLFPSDRAAVSGWCRSVFPAKVAHKVSVGSDPDLLQDLLDAEKRRAQHLLSPHQPHVFEILRRTHPGFLFEEMSKARRREIHKHGERRNIPRRRRIFFDLGNDELYSSIHSDEAQKRRVRVSVQLSIVFVQTPN